MGSTSWVPCVALLSSGSYLASLGYRNFSRSTLQILRRHNCTLPHSILETKSRSVKNYGQKFWPRRRIWASSWSCAILGGRTGCQWPSLTSRTCGRGRPKLFRSSRTERTCVSGAKKKKRSHISKGLLKALQIVACPQGEAWSRKTIKQRELQWQKTYRLTTMPKLQKEKFQEASVLLKQQVEVEKRTRHAMSREDRLAKTLRKNRKREQARRKVPNV